VLALFLTIFGCIAVIIVVAEVTERRKHRSAQDSIRRAAGPTVSEKKSPTRVSILIEEVVAGQFRPESIWPLPFLEAQIRAAGLTWQTVPTALAMAGLAAAGALIGSIKPILIYREASMIGLALALGCLPYM
jgi:hypothetical protein